jgi:hypothetical protein
MAAAAAVDNYAFADLSPKLLSPASCSSERSSAASSGAASLKLSAFLEISGGGNTGHSPVRTRSRGLDVSDVAASRPRFANL